MMGVCISATTPDGTPGVRTCRCMSLPVRRPQQSNFARSVSGARVTAISDPVASTRELAMQELGDVAEYSDFHALLEDKAVDAILIAAPTALHRDIAVAAAQRGKHVFCEKPMAMNA